MWHARRSREMSIGFSCVNLMEIYHVGNLRVDGRIILKIDFKNMIGGRVLD